VEAEVLTTRPSRSKPDRGTAVIAYAVRNQDANVVMTYKITHLLKRAGQPAGTYTV
jgi:hypothetical protein